MKQKLLSALVLLTCVSLFAADAPLRVFIRAGKKTHGPAGNGQHDGPTFLKDWTKMLTERGCKVDGAIGFPTGLQLDNTDVIVFYTEEGGRISPQDRANLEKFTKRGGGIVAIHDSVCGNDAQWWKTIIGGAWEHGYSKWLEHDVPIYYVNSDSPITRDCSNFEFDDEIYYDLHMAPEAKIVAASWTPDPRAAKGGRRMQHIYDVCPQMWTYEKDNYRAFVSIPGHHYRSFGLPHFRAVLLRGLAWAGKREVDSLCTKEELASLRYPEGGPSSPAKSITQLELHPEFNISVVAAEPLINKPIAIDWDASGRLWVAETPEYPNGRRGIKPEQAEVSWKDNGGIDRQPGKQNRPALDRISILADTNGDGLADRKDVFFEGLELVTGFVFHKDGVIVGQAPDILWLRDTNGDGKADKIEKLYTGLGTFDTHAVINNLRWGFDGWIYATHGYSAGDVSNANCTVSFGRISSGVVRFKPDGTEIEQYCSKGGNTWGLDITSDNEVMFTQPTSDDLLNHVVLPEYALARGKVGGTPSFKAVIHHRPSKPLIKFENLAYVQIDLVGLFTAAAGCAIYDHGSWPTNWNQSYFTTEPTINLVHHEIVKDEGVTYTANKTRDEEFVGGRDKWFRPIETRIGPDGALYVLDFYNQAVIHNDTRGPKHNGVNAAVRPDRDHYFGRVLRIDHKDAKKIAVPDLAKASAAELVNALDHPNRAVRLTAQRLLVENPGQPAFDALKKRPNAETADAGWIHRLWALHQLNELPTFILNSAANSPRPAVRKNAMRVAAVSTNNLKQSLLGHVNDPDSRVRLEAVAALGTIPVDKAVCDALVAAYPSFKDAWIESAAFGVLAKNPATAIASAFAQPKPDTLGTLVSLLVSTIAAKGDTETASALVVAAAKAPPSADTLKVEVLVALAKNLKGGGVPAFSDELRAALKAMLAPANPAVSAAALPLVSRWDTAGALGADAKPLVQSLLARLGDSSLTDDQRGQIASSLLGARQMDAQILPSVGKALAGANPALQSRLAAELGATGDAAAGRELVGAFAKLSPAGQDAAFTQIMRRADWAALMVSALKDGSVTLGQVGPTSAHRLRTHPDSAVAAKAREVIEALRGPEAKEKNALIAKLTAEVEKPGNATKGKELFAQNCGVCHKLNGEGKDVGPDLTGMGAHGAAQLLVAVLDPNREVDPSFVAWNIETKDEESYDGVIVSENRSAITLRNNAGEMQIKTANIKNRRNTGRSLMPEGFEALGAESLRDIMAFLSGGEQKYRIIDMRAAFTADSTRGIYTSQDNKDDTLRFKKFGFTRLGEVPFEILHPTKTASGHNVVVLKGGSGHAKTLPQRVEINNVNVKASRLHFLGGVAGWGWPCCGPNGNKDLPAAKVTVAYANGQNDEFTLKNGVEIADFNGNSEVPGSKSAAELLLRGQVRTFSLALNGKAPITKITLESFNNIVAPTFVAITAETGEPAGKVADAANATVPAPPRPTAPAAPAKPALPPVPVPPAKADGLRLLLVGGGSSHDFNRWFNQADRATLAALKPGWMEYTENIDGVSSEILANVDVLVWSCNKPITDQTAKALMSFADAGKSLVIVHPGLWYNWKNFTQWNQHICGGGARGHDRYGDFDVKVLKPGHPLMAGVPEQFKITDELYNSLHADTDAPIEVLAEATSPKTGKTFPQVWIPQHPKARIACITLGHDGKAHELPAFQTLLKNAVIWAAKK